MPNLEVKKMEFVKEAVNKVAMVDAGVKNKYNYGLETPQKEDPKNKIYYPCLYLSSKEAPMLKGSEVGDVKRLVMDVKIKGHRANEKDSGETCDDYDLEIHKIGLINK